MPRQITSPASLLDGAMALIQRDGVTSVTIEAVAVESGVSKGAVLHHFPTKSALMLALVERFAARIHSGIAERVAVDQAPGALIRALLDLSAPQPGSAEATDVERVMHAVLAAAIHDPALMQPLKAIGVTMRERMLADPQRGLSDLLLVLARDGLLLWQMVGFLDRGGPLSDRLFDELRRRAAPTGAAS